jgi:hypothetical protein
VNSNSSTKTGARSPNSSLSVTAPRQNKRRRYIRAVFGPKDRHFPKRDPEIEAMYPGHCIPSSPQMLEELLRRSLELEQSRSFVFGPRGGALIKLNAAMLIVARASKSCSFRRRITRTVQHIEKFSGAGDWQPTILVTHSADHVPRQSKSPHHIALIIALLK